MEFVNTANESLFNGLSFAVLTNSVRCYVQKIFLSQVERKIRFSLIFSKVHRASNSSFLLDSATNEGLERNEVDSTHFFRTHAGWGSYLMKVLRSNLSIESFEL